MYLILQDSLEFFVALLKLDDIFLKALASWIYLAQPCMAHAKRLNTYKQAGLCDL
jgi:hypothetical protein